MKESMMTEFKKSVMKVTARSLADIVGFIVKTTISCIADHNKSKPKKSFPVKRHAPTVMPVESRPATVDDAYDNWVDEPEPERPTCNTCGDSNGNCSHH
jgi:hypothetical protein